MSLIDGDCWRCDETMVIRTGATGPEICPECFGRRTIAERWKAARIVREARPKVLRVKTFTQRVVGRLRARARR